MPYIGNQPAPTNVTSNDITDGTITNVDINASAAIAATKIAGLSTVATTGAYSDVTGTPTIPVAGTDFVAQTGGTFTGDVSFGDNNKAIFGTGSDLQIYHDGSNSWINEVGTGQLILAGEDVRITTPNAGEFMATFGVNGAATLYYDNAAKLATTSTGIDVTGVITADDTINLKSTSGFASLEMGGPSGAYIDLKAPFTDDYDGRIQYDVGGNGALTISTNSGNSSPVIIKQQDSEKLRTKATGVDITGELIADSYNETYAALSGTSPAVNCETGNVFSLATTGNTTFTFSNPPASGTAYGFTLKVTAGGTHTLTWPSSVDWAGGTAPDAPASGETNVLVFITHDGGTTWYGFQAGAALA